MDKPMHILDLSEPCVLYVGPYIRKGYGRIRINGKLRSAHAVAWEKRYGPVPEGLQLDHVCKNKRCLNTSHLEPVTSRINSLRSNNACARNYNKTHCVNGHPFVGDNVRFYSDKDGRVRRRCMLCKHAYGNRSYYKDLEKSRKRCRDYHINKKANANL